jgi:excisionase family DNA binding protein
MHSHANTDGERLAGRAIADCDAALLDVHSVAALLNCSPRHVYRMSDAGRIPRPVRIGALVRWSRQTLENWVSSGCPSMRGEGAK